MINVIKPAVIPTALTGRGVTQTVNNCSKYNRSPASYNSNRSKFKILGSIYNAEPVKKALRNAQHKKCCFCEKMQTDEYGAVEHYRPKGGYKMYRKDKLKKPGYYWQSYIWENLFFVCGRCNTNKGNIFPLENELHRAKNHMMIITDEIPLLLDPAGPKNPRDHIKFNNELIYGVTDDGKQTIEICKLDRDGLNEERKSHLNEIEDKILTIISNLDPQSVNRAKDYIKHCITPQAKFSAMAIDFIAKSPILIV